MTDPHVAAVAPLTAARDDPHTPSPTVTPVCTDR